jgi:hypothetical protein
MLFFMGIYAIEVIFFEQQAHRYPLPAILFAGAMGGFISAQQRIQGVTDHGESLVGIIELSSLSSIFGNLWAPIAGAIFAAVLYMMLTCGFIDGNMVPKFYFPPQGTGIFLRLFCDQCGPADSVSAAKLALWCFVAGFAERLVPDALSRFVSTSAAKTNKANL